jgi:hypothetical protein
VRCHDDIGWTFSDEDAATLGVNGYAHRQFLNQFFTNRFEGSFARGVPFQENPKTGDCRISGTAASLAGLEKALKEETENEVELAVRRILLLHGLILSTGGVPLLYLGDEVGMLNDYTYVNDPAKVHDSRWVHRPFRDEKQYARRLETTTVEGRVYNGLRQLITLRQRLSALAGGTLQTVETRNDHVLGFIRTHADKKLTVLANFSEREQYVAAQLFDLPLTAKDKIKSQGVIQGGAIKLEPYQLLWIEA